MVVGGCMVAAGYASPASAAATALDLSDVPAPFHVHWENGARAKVSLHPHPTAPDRFVRVCVEQQGTKGALEHMFFWAFRTGDVVARVNVGEKTGQIMVETTPEVGSASDRSMRFSPVFPLGLRYIGRIAGERGEGGGWGSDWMGD